MKKLLLILLLLLVGCGRSRSDVEDQLGSSVAYIMEMYYVKGQVDALRDSLIVTRTIIESDTTGRDDTTYTVDYPSTFDHLLDVHYNPNLSEDEALLILKGLGK